MIINLCLFHSMGAVKKGLTYPLFDILQEVSNQRQTPRIGGLYPSALSGISACAHAIQKCHPSWVGNSTYKETIHTWTKIKKILFNYFNCSVILSALLVHVLLCFVCPVLIAFSLPYSLLFCTALCNCWERCFIKKVVYYYQYQQIQI